MSKPKLNVNQLMVSYKDQIAAALPAHLTADRMARLATTCIRSNKKLGEADPISLMGAIIRASQDGLEPGRTAHLVPFENRRLKITEVQYIADYRGLIQLARNSGEVTTFSAEVVRDGDFFEWELGTNSYLRHRPLGNSEAAITHAYAVATLRNGATQFWVLTRAEIDETRDQSAGYKNAKRYNRTDTPWIAHYPAMARKTAARRLCNWLPQSPELRRALEHDYQGETGQQDNRTVLEGHAAPVTDLNALLDQSAEPDEKVVQLARTEETPWDQEWAISTLKGAADVETIDDILDTCPAELREDLAPHVEAARERLG